MGTKTINVMLLFVSLFLALISMSIQDAPGKHEQETSDAPSNQLSSTANDENDSHLGRSAADDDDDDETVEDKDPAKLLLVLKQGDPFSVLVTDSKTGCLILTEDQLPKSINGGQSYRENCDEKQKCKLYTTVSEPAFTCLKPTHLVCDESIGKCVCGNEGVAIAEIRFQYGTREGKDHRNGRCLIRPTFDYIHGFECSPGTVRKEIAVEEEAESIPICACESEADFDKFSSTDPDWWKCSKSSSIKKLEWLVFLFWLSFWV